MKTEGEDDGPIPMPPAAPRPGRRLRFARPEAVTIALLGFVVVTALMGWYDHRASSRTVQVGGIDATVESVSRTRLQRANILAISLTNRGTAAVDTVTITVNTSYMAGYEDVLMSPEAVYPFVTRVTGMEPGDVREYRLSGHAIRTGRHNGVVSIATRSDTARVPFTTLILP